MEKEASIIIPMRDEGMNVYDTIRSVHGNTEGINYEVIVIDDGSTDRNYSDLVNLGVRYFKTAKRGAAKSRNLGAKYAVGKILVFLDAHMTLSPEWLNRLIAVTEENRWSIAVPVIYDVDNPSRKGYSLTWKSWALDYKWLYKKSSKCYEVPLGTCACTVVPRRVFDMVGGFDQGVKDFGLDEEIFLRAWLLGYKAIIEPSVEVGHLFKSRFTYRADIYIRNILRLACIHLKPETIAKVVAAWKNHPNFPKAKLLNAFSDVWIRRWILSRKRIHDEDWFFKKFNITL